MKNTNDSADDGDQLTAPVSDYRALLETTRPLIITKVTRLSSRVPIYGDQAISFEARDCPGESVVKRGEIVYPDLSEQTLASHEGVAGTTPLPQPNSGLTIRIYLGMS